MVPFTDGQSFVGVLREAGPNQIIERFARHPIMGRPPDEAAAAPEDGWTGVYDDPAGAGWAVAYAAPVEGDGRPLGVVGAAVLLDFLTSFLRAFDSPVGQLWLVNDRLQVLAASDAATYRTAPAPAQRLVAIDEAGLVVEFNPSTERMFGIPAARALGQRWPS